MPSSLPDSKSRRIAAIARRLRGLTGFLVLSLCQAWPASAVDLNTITDLRLRDGVVTVSFSQDPDVYYLLEYSRDLTQWGPADMSLGIQSVVDLETALDRGFFRAVPLSRFSPMDSDGDGIDDVYELNNNVLDPLNPNDGSQLAPGGGGLTNFQVYLGLFGINSYQLIQRESREITVFNFGSAPDADAVSREQSIFNLGSPLATFQAASREVSIYNGAAVPTSEVTQIQTREWSIFNFNSPLSSLEAISRSVSLYNGEAVPAHLQLQMESREISIFNLGSPLASAEAISREVSVLNFEEP